ncbi:hypothetical protein BKA80DRAFT_263755 [Phyllosticta citrichinensis]
MCVEPSLLGMGTFSGTFRTNPGRLVHDTVKSPKSAAVENDSSGIYGKDHRRMCPPEDEEGDDVLIFALCIWSQRFHVAASIKSQWLQSLCRLVGNWCSTTWLAALSPGCGLTNGPIYHVYHYQHRCRQTRLLRGSHWRPTSRKRGAHQGLVRLISCSRVFEPGAPDECKKEFSLQSFVNGTSGLKKMEPKLYRSVQAMRLKC